MKNRKLNQISLKHAFNNNIVILILLGSLFVLDILVFFILFAVTKNEGIRTALIVSGLSLAGLTIAYVIYIIVRYYNSYIKGLYQNTLNNYNKIIEEKSMLDSYVNKEKFQEINELNDTIDKINDIYKNFVIKNGKMSYKEMGLEFVEGEDKVITYDSFEKNYRKLLDGALNFRNAFISLQYPRSMKPLSRDEFKLFKITIQSDFKFENILIINHEKMNEYILYVPRFDSLDNLKETVANSLKDFAVNRTTSKGYELVSCRATVVIYPYSAYEDIIGDLRYAKRSNKALNFYMPNKPGLKSNTTLSESRNINIISRSLEKISLFENEKFTFDELNKKVTDLFNNICEYFSIELAGVVEYDKINDKFINTLSYGKYNKSNVEIEREFIEALNEHIDSDGTVYFSNRNNVNQTIGRFLDRFGIESGHYYVIRNNGKPEGLVYFAKYSPCVFDCYIREALLVYSFFISTYIYRMNNLGSISRHNTMLSDILKITGCMTYQINKADYTITNFSPNLKNLFPQIKVGSKCYEAIQGKSKRCEKCPFRNGRKIPLTIKKNKYEASLTLTEVAGKTATILLNPIKGKDYTIRERFDHDLLINSYYSFFENLKDSFMINERGYILVLNIDNIDTLLSKLQTEQLNAYLRLFFNNIKEVLGETTNIYSLSNYSYAIVKPLSNNNDIVDLSEKIYNMSKVNYLGTEENMDMNISYFIFPYPFGYQNSDDYARFVRANSVFKKEQINNDLIFVAESKYIRSASHKKYLIDILDTNITMNTFRFKLQPILDKATKSIVASELLFRIADVNRGGELNTFEVINVAAQEKKIQLITKLLIDYIDYLYQNYDKTMFKRYNLNKLTMNVDYSFFQDSDFLNRVNELKAKYKLNDNFIELEIAENEIGKHLEQLSSILEVIKSNNITLICDNYTGEILTLEKLQSLGFNGIKISRNVVQHIESDENALEGVKTMVEVANTLKFDVTFVGVENSKQYNLLRDIKYNFKIQGFYFYRPLDEHELANALFKSNK